MNDAATIASVSTGLLAVIGTIVAKILEARAKRLEADLANESALRSQLMGRIDALEFKLAEAADREMTLARKINELEVLLRDKESAARELRLKYEALAEAHHELSDRYKFSEQQNRKLRDEMLAWYINEGRRHTPVPPKYDPRDLSERDD